MMKPLGLGYQKIDMCPNFCMLYYLENAEMTECMTCGHSRYKPRRVDAEELNVVLSSTSGKKNVVEEDDNEIEECDEADDNNSMEDEDENSD